MMGSFIERGKTGSGVGREGELCLDPSEFEMPRHPSGEAEWAVGYLSLEFRSHAKAGAAELGLVGI